MASNRSYTVIGAFVLGALALLTVAILAFGGFKIFTTSREAVIFFDQSVLGLTSGSRVLFRGVEIGTVKKVQLRLDPSASKARIAVTVAVTGEDVVNTGGNPLPSDMTVQEMVDRGLRAQLVVYSYVTSQLAVNFDFRPKSKPRYVVDPDELELPEIPAIPSEIEQLKDTVADLPWKDTLKSVNSTMQNMAQLAGDLDATVNALRPGIEQTTAASRQTLDTVRRAIKDNNADLQQTIAAVHRLTDHMNDLIVAHNAQIGSILKNTAQTTRQLNTLSTNLAGLSDPGSGSSQDLKSALRDLSASAASLRRFSQTIERDPHTLFYGSPNQ